ncbi:MAG TPA: CehA/McbA family metallohydrolase [Solirubrobacteraceae bacterium]|nr:CehA/McbA family metallohydrolase [Solirubrobacteraceae bacterium]
MSERLSIAHVSPYPWEDAGELSAHVRSVAGELSRRGHRVLVLAPSRSADQVRETRRVVRAARADAAVLLDGTDGGLPRALAVGEVLDVLSTRRQSLALDVSRTVEEILASVPLDVVHVHDPFAPSTANAALRFSRALNVGSFHASGERALSATIGRRLQEGLFGRLDARTVSRDGAAAELARLFGGEYVLVPDDEHAAARYEETYARLAARRHDGAGAADVAARLAARPLIDVDLHMHTDHSGDCETPVEVLLATAAEQGLGAIAVTDHNEISGAREAAALADRFGVKVIVGEEVKTRSEGEVIGLFLRELIPRGLTLRATIDAIRAQGGIVYVPHPFDRMHAVPDYEHLLPVIDDVDAIEIFNPRVALSSFNEEAARFAAKYRITAGAGSDSHVAQGLGTVRIRMRDFDGPAEFLQSLREADILTRSGTLLYVQALKFLQTKAAPPAARRASKARRVRRVGRRQRRSGL